MGAEVGAMVVMLAQAQVVIMTQALVLVMVDQEGEAFMVVGQVMVAVVAITLMLGSLFVLKKDPFKAQA